MTQIAAIATSLLKGEVLSIMDGYRLFACSNLPRELSRSIEQKFDVQISRERVKFKSKYGQPGSYLRYRLNKSQHNLQGIQKMKEYVNSQLGSLTECKTDKQLKQFVQQKLFLDSL